MAPLYKYRRPPHVTLITQKEHGTFNESENDECQTPMYVVSMYNISLQVVQIVVKDMNYPQTPSTPFNVLNAMAFAQSSQYELPHKFMDAQSHTI